MEITKRSIASLMFQASGCLVMEKDIDDSDVFILGSLVELNNMGILSGTKFSLEVLNETNRIMLKKGMMRRPITPEEAKQHNDQIFDIWLN